MQGQVWRIVESVVAFILLILTIIYWNRNQLGQNLINFEAVGMWAVGLQNILIGYRWLIGEQSFEYQVSLLMFSLLLVGKLFEKHHPTEMDNSFNSICEFNVMAMLYANFVFILFMMGVLVLYACRQVYRLMTETLLSANANLEPGELQQIIALKKPYSALQRDSPDASHTCSICLMQFEGESSAILLPVCEHCFHEQCIREWLQTKSTCPYCRNNIRLSIL